MSSDSPPLSPAPSHPLVSRLSRASRWWRREFPPSQMWRAIPTAVLCWFLTVTFSVSLAALIFQGPLEAALSTGIGLSLFSAVTTGLVVTFLGTVPGTIAIPSDRTAPMLAILAGGIVALYPAGTAAGVLLPTVLAALILSTFLTGVVLSLLGHYRLGRLIRFLPFPVVGGFMAGAGWLLLKGAFTVVTDRTLDVALLGRVFEWSLISKWAPALGLALLLMVVMRHWHHFLTVPVLVLGAVVVFYTAAWFQGIPLETLRTSGWLPGPFPVAIHWEPNGLAVLGQANWRLIAEQVETLGALVLVGTISLLMIASAMELSAERDVEADRELEAAGIANLVTACGGGLVGMHSLSLTSLALRLGPRNRWVGLFTAVGSGLTLFVGPSVVGYLPMPVIGGLLAYLGLNFLSEWLLDSYSRIPRSEYALIVLILLVIAWVGYLPGIGIGLITAVALFALRYSRIEVVRLELGGQSHRSNVDRTPHERALLKSLRPSIHVMKLQGFIFFGTAHGLMHRVKRRVHRSSLPALRYLILDFRHVTGLDSSALLSFRKLQQSARLSGFQVLCCSLPPRLLMGLQHEPGLLEGPHAFRIEPDADRAVEWCESQLLAPHQAELVQEEIPFEELLAIILQGRDDIAARLAPYFERMESKAGAVLAVQGERSRDLFLIERGQVSAQLKSGHGESIRLRTMGPSSIMGEIGLYLHAPRTASLIVDVDSVIWRLSPEALTRMEETDSQVSAALHETLARLTTIRLIQANELLETTLR